MTISTDLVSQAWHCAKSPVWLFTDYRGVGEAVLKIMPRVIKDMPNREVYEQADYSIRSKK